MIINQSVSAHRWPGNARCVVMLTVDFDGTGNEVGQGFDPAGIRSAGGYSARRACRECSISSNGMAYRRPFSFPVTTPRIIRIWFGG